MIKWLEEYLDYFTFPALFFGLLWVDRERMAAEPARWALLFGLGWLIWTLAEYVIHRFVLHRFYWHGVHQLHHVKPRTMSRFPLWQIPTYFAAFFGLYWLASRDWCVALYAGTILGWVMFITLHTAMHHFPRLLPRFSRRHDLHHRRTHWNYGITVDWWDRLFGTYKEVGLR